MYFVAWRHLEGKFCDPRNKQKLSESRGWEKREKVKGKVIQLWVFKPSCIFCQYRNILSCLIPSKKSSQRGNSVGLENTLAASLCHGLWHVSLICIYPNSSMDIKVETQQVVMPVTSTKSRWAANKGSLTDFWNGFWEVIPPANGARRPWPQSSGQGSCPRNTGACMIFSEYIPKSHCTFITFCCTYASYFRSCCSSLIHPGGKGYAHIAYLRQMA